MAATGLFDKVARGLARDKDIALGQRVQKGLKLLSDTAAARIGLRSCTSVGPGARVDGRVRVENRGLIRIGSGLSVIATFLPVELLTTEGGSLEIGDDVWLNFGTVLSASSSV